MKQAKISKFTIISAGLVAVTLQISILASALAADSQNSDEILAKLAQVKFMTQGEVKDPADLEKLLSQLNAKRTSKNLEKVAYKCSKGSNDCDVKYKGRVCKVTTNIKFWNCGFEVAEVDSSTGSLKFSADTKTTAQFNNSKAIGSVGVGRIPASGEKIHASNTHDDTKADLTASKAAKKLTSSALK